jgi:hypothetical protein
VRQSQDLSGRVHRQEQVAGMAPSAAAAFDAEWCRTAQQQQQLAAPAAPGHNWGGRPPGTQLQGRLGGQQGQQQQQQQQLMAPPHGSSGYHQQQHRQQQTAWGPRGGFGGHA